MKYYIGIDPGQKGYICMITPNGTYRWAPLADNGSLRELLKELPKTADIIAVVENVHAMPKQGLSSTFNFGYNVGWITGVLWGFGIPTCSVTPNKWQREMWDSRDIVKTNGKTDPKKTSARAAARLHPTFDFRKSDRARKPDDNKVDATLIADFAKRKNL